MEQQEKVNILKESREKLSSIIQDNIKDSDKVYYRALLRCCGELDLAIAFIENPERELVMNKRIWSGK